MSKFQFSSEAYADAARMLISNVLGSVNKAFDILAEDVDKQKNKNKRRWHHKKRGTNYTEEYQAHLQIATTPPKEDDIIVIYIDEESGRVCAREKNEFLDGRFVELEPHP